MIPKIIHMCWLSNSAIPDNIQKYIDTWHRHMPDYEIRLWNFDRFPKDKSAWVSEAFDARKYAFAADYVRNYALYHEGGIYLDADIEVLKNFDELLTLKYFFGLENGSGLIDAGIMGAEAGHPLFKMLLDYYDSRHFVNNDGSLNTLPLPKLYKKLMDESGYTMSEVDDINGMRDHQNHAGSEIDVAVLPFDYFSPIHQEHRRLEKTDRTMAIHRFAASWVPWHGKIKRTIKRIVGPNATEWFIRNKRRLLGRKR